MNELPFFSIIVPTYNRPHRLAGCLRALADLNYPRDRYEVVVVDDGSLQSSEEMVLGFEGEMCADYIHQENQGPAVARNNGARRANGRFLAFTDDDCAPTASWLRQLASQLSSEPQKMVGGYTRNALPRNPFSITSQLLIDYLYQHFNRTESRARFFTSNNFALSTELFWQVGGFDETMPLAAGEDREFCDRWLEKGLEMVYFPGAIIFHAHKLGAFSFWQQHFNYGRGAWHYRVLRSRRTETAVPLESLQFYWQLIRFPLTMANGVRAYILAGMLGLTQAINATGFFYERFVGQWGKKKLP
ncbi:MAG: glycosyltransferase [Chloroflexi bacterium]|nr:glycosyltransferase [Chloroflexota bacterium]